MSAAPPSLSSLRIPLRLGLAAAVVFALLAAAVAGAGVPPLEALEEHWLRQLHAQRDPLLTMWMVWVERLNDPVVAVALSAFVTALLFRRRWRELPLLLAITLGGGVMNNLAKGWFQRERPGLDALVSARGFGFPSGHTVAVTLLAAWMVYLACRDGRPGIWRAAGVLGAVVSIAVVGASRIYLGAHYPSDVAAAFFAGTAWACGCIALFNADGPPRPPSAGRHTAPAKGAA